MRPSTLVGLALLFGAFTAYLVAKWAGVGAQQAAARPHVRLVVAAQPIEAGSVIAGPQLKTIEWLSAELPTQAVLDPKNLVGRVTRFPLQPGELVLESKLAPVDAKAGLSALITEGKRAISVRVNEVIAVAGFTLPGNYVDVLVSGKDNAQQAFARVVITRAKVLAIAQDTAADPSKPKVVNAVTLELTPQEAERLDLARTVGTLSLVLRNESDNAPLHSAGTRLPDILGPLPFDNAGAGQTPRITDPNPGASAPLALAPAGVKRTSVPAARRLIVQEIRGFDRDEVHP